MTDAGTEIGDSAEDWLRSARRAERRGELLQAVDVAQRGLEHHPDDLALRYETVLALARAGSTEEARRRFHDYRLDEEEAEDVAALGARIEKDVALAELGARRRQHAQRAAELYEAVFDRTGGYYPGINAATLSLLAGDRDRAVKLAREVLALTREATGDEYYRAATAAEAELLLGEREAAARSLEKAAAANDGDLSAVATTRRQLRLICAHTDTEPGLLAALAVPGVVHYCGHRVVPLDGRFGPGDEASVRERVGEELGRLQAGFGYGSLASGADVLFAEALLERGAELHVVLPFEREEFVATSVSPAGPGWAERFERCLAAASSITYATEDAYLGDDLLFRYAAELAMGLALLRARFLDAGVAQIAVWDGRPAAGPAGTAVVETWRGRDLPSIVVPLGAGREPPDGASGQTPSAGRVIRAMLFGDIRGFSKLGDTQVGLFHEHVMEAVASALRLHEDRGLYRNTWGDGVLVVLPDAIAAAACALDLQAAVSQLDLASAGLPDHLALRLGGHVGPVLVSREPVLGTRTYTGTQVSRTARIEPVTPPGSVYVSEPFAAQLALHGGDLFTCDYVGHMPAAKDYGRLRMYLLRRRRIVSPR